MYTIPQIVVLAKISQYLYNNDQAQGVLYGQVIDPEIGKKLYIIRRDVEDVYNLNPNYAGLQGAANFLLGLCDLRSYGITGSGGSVSPIFPIGGNGVYLIPITGASFTDATHYDNTLIVGKNLAIFWNDINRFLYNTEYAATSSGVQIIAAGFDAVANPTYDLLIYIVNP
jgi:hypothetical protein